MLRLGGVGLMAPLLLAAMDWPPTAAQWAAAFAVPAMTLAAVSLHVRSSGLRESCPLSGERLIWITALAAIAGQILLLRLVPQIADGSTGPLLAGPAIAQALLLASLLGVGMAATGVTATLMMGLAAGVMTAPQAGAAWVAAFAAVHLAAALKRRSDLMRAIGGVCGLMLLASASERILARQPMPGWQPWGELALWALVSGIGAVAIFWLGVALLERLSGAVSDWTLLEISNSDHPLLQKLAMQAPGTYAHSIMVANLAESAARAIGANPVLVRAMAMFHDIGKMERPYCFVENQAPGDNIHDTLAPETSAGLIIDHVVQGSAMARKAGLPQPVIDAVEQHHGTSLIHFFFHRARALDPSSDEAAFRYPGPRPRSREAAILHLADQAEAACRTLRDPEDAPDLIRALVQRSLDDGQLREAPLTLADLHQISQAMGRSLLAARHHRVEYPSLEPSGHAGHLDQAGLRSPNEADAHPERRDDRPGR
jgi:putative nucleotidyltransferase with HDIG domain